MEKANLKHLAQQIEEIKATQERILAIVEGALGPSASGDFERKRLIAQHGGDVLAALKEHNRRQKSIVQTGLKPVSTLEKQNTE